MPLPLVAAEREQFIKRMQLAHEFNTYEVAVPEMGFRTTVYEVVYVPERKLAWMSISTGQWRLPVGMHAWAQLVVEELADRFALEGEPLFPFSARFSMVKGAHWVIMERPE